MQLTPFPNYHRSEIKTLSVCLLVAFIVELTLLGLLADHHDNHVRGHGAEDQTKFMEAELVNLPDKVELTSEKKMVLPSAKPEPVLSRVPGQGKAAKPGEAAAPEENQVKSAPPAAALAMSPNHGPVILSNPAPVIPGYLKNNQINTSVVIEFSIAVDGSVTPRLLASSDNEELDAIALSTAKRWQFRPAEKDGKPVDAKVKLRILFEVQ